MSTTLHIDGLVASIGDQALAAMLSQFGEVLSVQMYQRGTTSASGAGTVEMANLEVAQKALSALHRSRLGGLLVLVFLASVGT
ncbi:MAG: RNA-binding protein [Nitrospira sp.]|nr:RNA-binding protein [Nitrospira sp.]